MDVKLAQAAPGQKPPASKPADNPHFTAGMSLVNDGKFEGAADEFSKALDPKLGGDPNNPQFNYWYGVALANESKFTDAATYLKIAAGSDGDHMHAEYHYAYAYALTRESPSDENTALSELNQAVSIDPNTPLYKYDRAVLLARTKQFQSAEKDLRTLVDADSKRDDYHYWLGVTLAGEGSYSAAIEQAKQAISIAPQNALYYYQLGQDDVALRDWTGAENAFKAAKQKAPTEPLYRFALGYTLIFEFRYVAATSEISAAIADDSANPAFYFWRGMAEFYVAVAPSQYTPAISDFTDADRKSKSSNAEYAYWLGAANLRASKFSDAATAFLLATKRAPHKASYWHELGLALSQTKSPDLQGAADAYATACFYDPKEPYFKEEYDAFTKAHPGIKGATPNPTAR